MKVVLFADLHAYPHRPYATAADTGLNSRLQDCLNTLDQIRQFCKDEQVDFVVGLGDLFHRNRIIDADAFNGVYERLALFHASDIRVALMPGNHDWVLRAGSSTAGHRHSLSTLRTFATVWSHPCWTELGDLAALVIPYARDPDYVIKARQLPIPDYLSPRKKILLGHFGVQGAKVGSDFVISVAEDVRAQDLHFEQLDWSFLGHYHEPQSLAPNAWYVGSPLQHTWGDRDGVRGWMVLDTETGRVEHIESDAPRFVEIETEGGGFNEDDCIQSFVRIRHGEQLMDLGEQDRIRQALLAAGALSVEFVPSKTSALQSGNGVELTSDSLNLAAAVVRYASDEAPEELSPEWLTRVGLELLAGKEDER